MQDTVSGWVLILGNVCVCVVKGRGAGVKGGLWSCFHDLFRGDVRFLLAGMRVVMFYSITMLLKPLTVARFACKCPFLCLLEGNS